MNRLQLVVTIVFVMAVFLLTAGCTATAVPPDEVAALPPTLTPEPTNTATAVPQLTSPSPSQSPSPTNTPIPTPTPTDTPTPTPTHTVPPTPEPTATMVTVVISPVAATQAEGRDLGIEHLQIAEETTLKGDSYSINLLNEPGGSKVVATTIMGSLVTIEDTAVYDDIYWYFVDTEQGQGWVSEYYFLSLDQAVYMVTPEAVAAPMLPWLVNTDDMNQLENVLDIYDWQLAYEDASDSQACHAFYGASWSINPNLSINCIFPKETEVSFEHAMNIMFEWGILYADAIPLPLLTNIQDREAALYGGRLENGHAVYDLFVNGETAFYWASISLGTPGGYDVEMVYDAYGNNIEAFLYSIVEVNLERNDE